MPHSRIALLALPILVIFLAINRVDQLLWTYILGPKLFYGDSRGPYGEPLIGSQGIREPPNDPGRKSWPLDGVPTYKREIVVLTGTTFKCNDVHCRLLGIKESLNPSVRKQAKEFSKAWFAWCEGNFNIYNSRKPIVESHVSIVWLGYSSGEISYLSEELVRSGLVTVDQSSKQDYDFKYFDGENLKAIDWRSGLASAEDDFTNGKPSKLLSKWQRGSSPNVIPANSLDLIP